MAIKYKAGRKGLPPVERARLLHEYRKQLKVLRSAAQRLDAALAKDPYTDDTVFLPWMRATVSHARAEDLLRRKGIF